MSRHVIAVTDAQASMIRRALASWIEDAGRTDTDESMVKSVRRQLGGLCTDTERDAIIRAALRFTRAGR